MGHDPNPSTPPIGEAIFLFLRKISPLLLSSVSDVSKVFPTHLSPCSVPFQDDWWLLRQSLLKNCFFLRELKLKGTQSEGGEGVQDAPKVAPGSPLHHHQSACTAFYPIQLGTTSRNFLGRPLSQKKKRTERKLGGIPFFAEKKPPNRSPSKFLLDWSNWSSRWISLETPSIDWIQLLDLPDPGGT